MTQRHDPLSTRHAPRHTYNPVMAIGNGVTQLPPDNRADNCHIAQQERALWRAVIVQALMDAACGSKKYEAEQARNEAINWLRGGSQDFATVCYYAGFEPDCVRRMAERSLEGGCHWRALPGKGTRKRPERRKSERRATQRR